jgi:hypothetical protein
MFYYTIKTYGELPVAGILAHEWGHRAQFSIGWQDYKKNAYRELEADAFSGYYMALAKQYAWSQIQSYYQNIYASGDYNYNNPQHHGTPDQRLQAAYLGVNTAIYAMNNGIKYTYNDLHNLFISKIQTEIAPKLLVNKNDLREVVYPKTLNKKTIVSLYPTIN